MLKIFLLLTFTLFVNLSAVVAVKLEKINIIIKIDTEDKKLKAALDDHKKILEEKAKLKIVSHRNSYLEAEGKQYLEKLLKSLGYYDGEVEIQESSELKTNDITFKIIPNVLYMVGFVKIIVLDSSKIDKAKLNLPSKDWHKLKTGDRATAKSILSEEARLQEYIENDNSVLRVEVVHEAILNLVNKTVNVNYNIIAGPIAYIKDVKFDGLKTVMADYARKIVDIKNGDDFKISEVKRLNLLLQQSGLFNAVEPIIPSSVDKDGGIDLMYKVKERKHKSVKAGLNYSTDLGAGVTLGLEHRNVFHQGEKVSTTLTATKKEQTLDTQFQKPCFLHDTQTLKLNNIISKEETLAYNDKGGSLSAVIEREFSKKIKGGAGIKYSLNRIEDNTDQVQNFGLLSLPIYGAYDARDNILNPTKGVFINLAVSPFFNTINRKEKFTKKVISGRAYIQADSALEPVFAIKGETGIISGARTSDIPATERFYSGGAGSVRGYGYQLVGPLNKKNEPIGGRSYVETALEIRLRVSKNVGLVVFSDGGNVEDSTVTKFDKKLIWGAGFGVRYYTDFAPLRFDVAFPVSKKRRGIDKAFQLYFSIGQAF